MKHLIPKSIRESIALRTAFLIQFFVLLVLLVGGVWQIRHVRNIVSAEVHYQASKAMDVAITMIDNRVSNVETAVNTAASYANMFAFDEQGVYTLLNQLIVANKDIEAVTMLYKENFFPKHGRYFAPTVVYNPSDGSYEEDEIGGPEHDFCYLETDSTWVYTNKLDKGYWCLPYIDSMSTKRPMVTYSVPLHDETGAIYAVLCADVNLHWVQRIVNEAKPYAYSQISVLSRDARYICHPDSNSILSVDALKLARSKKDTEFLALTQRMLQGKRGVDTIDKRYIDELEDEENDDDFLIYYAPVKRVQWAVGFTYPTRKIMEKPNQLRAYMIFFRIVTLLLILAVTYLIIHAQLRPLKAIAQSTQEVAKGNFQAQLPVVRTHDEVRQFRDSFAEMQRSLANYVEELKTTTASKASMESELKVASGIQMAMLPKQMPPFPERTDIDLYAMLKPAKDVGGDLFDFLIRDEHLYFCVGDVSGKGVPAALFMAMVRSLFRNITSYASSPAEIIMALNRGLADGNDYNMFCTMFLGVLNLKTGQMDYCNAGHNAPVLRWETDGQVVFDYTSLKVNMPLGVFDGFEYEEEHAQLQAGDGIFLYTDGVTEAEDIHAGLFGEERLLAVLRECHQHGNVSPRDYVDAVYHAVKQHAKGAEQSDDITMMMVEYKGNQG
ncbi:MAG: SpoIIE family protein phosphatase [Prevotella sp.]|nr:SpoIIE family protein phosphatase [Prevotella sp.]